MSFNSEEFLPLSQSYSARLLENFSFMGERESLTSTHDFIMGELMDKLKAASSGDVEAKLKYHRQCLRSLDFSFNEIIVRDLGWLDLLAGSIEDMESQIHEAFLMGSNDPESMRDRLPLDTAPFKYAKRRHRDLQSMPKDDDVRIVFQALFLFVLRPFVALKYTSMDSFLDKYPGMLERNLGEQERLRYTANWMDLAFYTIQPRNNKTFILSLIPRIVEGKNARYITGSGQTRPTADRVDLFRLEGNCEKIKRPPRRKKEPGADELLADPTLVAATAAAMAASVKPSSTGLPGLLPEGLEALVAAGTPGNSSAGAPTTTGNMFAQFLFPYYSQTYPTLGGIPQAGTAALGAPITSPVTASATVPSDLAFTQIKPDPAAPTSAVVEPSPAVPNAAAVLSNINMLSCPGNSMPFMMMPPMPSDEESKKLMNQQYQWWQNLMLHYSNAAAGVAPLTPGDDGAAKYGRGLSPFTFAGGSLNPMLLYPAMCPPNSATDLQTGYQTMPSTADVSDIQKNKRTTDETMKPRKKKSLSSSALLTGFSSSDGNVFMPPAPSMRRSASAEGGLSLLLAAAGGDMDDLLP